MSVIKSRSLSCETVSVTWNMMVDPPVKSMPGFRPGAIMRKTTPGKSTRADIKKEPDALSYEVHVFTPG